MGNVVAFSPRNTSRAPARPIPSATPLPPIVIKRGEPSELPALRLAELQRLLRHRHPEGPAPDGAWLVPYVSHVGWLAEEVGYNFASHDELVDFVVVQVALVGVDPAEIDREIVSDTLRDHQCWSAWALGVRVELKVSERRALGIRTFRATIED